MPHIRIRGMKEAEVIKVSTDLLDELVKIVQVPKDHFTLEYVPSRYIYDGKLDGNMYPFVEVLWFDRGDLMQSVTDKINELLKPFDYEDITVYFTNLEPGHYFENGQHF